LSVLSDPASSSGSPELAHLGVSRASDGSLFAWAADGALVDAANELLGLETPTSADSLLNGGIRNAAFAPRT